MGYTIDKVDIDRIKSKIRTTPNWPKEGVMFRDVMTLLKDFESYNYMMRIFFERYKNFNVKYIVGIESRGFIFAAMLADRLGVGFVPIRKKGKLPPETISQEYDLEYGKDCIEISKDSIEQGATVLVVDDLIATGGTCLATCNLLKKMGADILECCFIIDLPDLGGKKKLTDAGYSVFNLLEFEGE